MQKSIVRPLNSNKNELNGEIILIVNLYPNPHIVSKFFKVNFRLF